MRTADLISGHPFGGDGGLFGTPWAAVNEYFHFDDVTLR
jgi:hypothetical protein